MTPARHSDRRLPLAATLAAFAAFAALQIAAFITAGGHFDYPLDDPYIHLAIAEQIAGGNYGVNDNEYAAAASSPLYPLLLTPFPGEPIQRFLPLVWNIAALLASSWLWGAILARAGLSGALGLAFAILGPLALNFHGLAFLGMEHTLHLAASLAIVLGLLNLALTGRAGPLLPIGILFAPLFRFEGLALAILAAVLVVLTGRVRSGLALLALAVLPVAAFAALLTSMGLSPVPASVYAKLAVMPEAQDVGPLGYVLNKLAAVAAERREQILAAFLIVAMVFAALPSIRRSPRRIVLAAVTGAGAAHLIFGRFGWLDRYEIYALATVAAGLLAVAPLARRAWVPALVLVPLGMALTLYAPLAINLYPHAPRAVWLQQGQMARFARDHLSEPVAVNDLGYVAWADPDYVLDVWGLANREALRIRLEEDQPPGWLGDLTAAQGVPVAMVYDGWFRGSTGTDWRLLGQLRTTGRTDYLGGTIVNVWLTEAARDAAPYRAALKTWAQGLPDGAEFTFANPVTD